MAERHRPNMPRLALPDPLLARQALHEMRSAMRQGFGLMRDGIGQAPLPEPVATITGNMLRQVDDLAHHVDEIAQRLVGGFLDAGATAGEDSAMGIALRQAADQLGAADLRINEIAVREATGTQDIVENADDAAAVMCRLLAAGAVQPSGPDASAAIFAAVLFRLQGAGDAAGQSSSLAIAKAVSEEITAAGTATAPLARLFAEFKDHV